jgi:hypothetical protein
MDIVYCFYLETIDFSIKQQRSLSNNAYFKANSIIWPDQ